MKKKAILLGAIVLALLVALAWMNAGTLRRLAYAGAGRDTWQMPERVIEALALKEGDVVADIGAGGGYFTFRLASAVGRKGKVYAVDVDREMIRHIESEAVKRSAGNVTGVLAEPKRPLLPEAVDWVFLANTYHHLPERVEYFRDLAPALRGGGRIAIVEYRGDGWLSRIFGHATAEAVIREEMNAAGYRLAAQHTFLPRQHFMIFEVAPRD